MVFAAISQLTQGHLYIAVVDALIAPDVRQWLRSPFNPDSADNSKVYYMIPTMDVDISNFGPVSITWVTSDLIMERHSTTGALCIRPNLLHSDAETYRATYIKVRDRPRYQVVGFNIPLEPIIALAETDGSVSSIITAPVNLIQVANLQTITGHWAHSYDDDSDAPPTPAPDSQDDSPIPSPFRDQRDTEDDDNTEAGDHEVPEGEE